MAHKTGQSRYQYGLFATPLDELIAADNEVRIIDAFVDALDLSKLGFEQVQSAQRGAPAYHPAVLLKIYIYGYLNRVRSSRRLEKECHRNVEMMWLTNCQEPSYHTISDFRSLKPHRKALKSVFRLFNQILSGEGLFGNETVAIDGTKIRAQNSKKRHISEEKIQKRLDYNENKFMEYLDELDRADLAIARGEVPAVSPEKLNQSLDEVIERTKNLEALLGILHQAQENDPSLRQISLTDPDARMLATNKLGHTEIAYNVQSIVDDKNYLVADFSVENISDIHLLYPTAEAAKTALGVEKIEVLADKGYHYSQDLDKCAQNQITTYVAYPDQDYKSKKEGYRKEDFPFDEKQDAYTCPAGHPLTTDGTVHDKHNRTGQVQNHYKLYRISYRKCKNCPFNQHCLTKSNRDQRHGRSIERSIYEKAVLENRQRILNHRDKYKRRQAIVEHPFGTIKRSWGYYYTLLKGKSKVSAEYSLVFLSYNLRRAINLLGFSVLIQRVKHFFLRKTRLLFEFSAIFTPQPFATLKKFAPRYCPIMIG